MQYKILANILITDEQSEGQPVLMIDGKPYGPRDEYCGIPGWMIVELWRRNPSDHGMVFDRCEGEALQLATKYTELATLFP